MTTAGNIAEVFRSWQGEGLLMGRRQVFVRLAGCAVGCRYCDTAWAFDVPASVAVPGARGRRLANPLDATTVAELVAAADPGGDLPVTVTGGEPLEQPDFVEAIVDAVAPREVMLETAGLHGEALVRLAPRVRWIACDIKLPGATGLADVAARQERALDALYPAGAVRGATEIFFKLVVDGDTTDEEVAAAAARIASRAPGAVAFLQPVTPLGGSPALPSERFDALADRVAAAGLDVRLVPQVHKRLGVR